MTAEPEVVSRVMDGEQRSPRLEGFRRMTLIILGNDYAYAILVTDGITSLMSDQEIVDLARDANDPTRAATSIIHFAEDLNAEDNCTAIVVPLAGWGQVGGKDNTEARREYRRTQAGELSTRMQRM